jgi:RHS repeat-associated protein
MIRNHQNKTENDGTQASGSSGAFTSPAAPGSGNAAGASADVVQIPPVNLPKGGGAIKGIEEKFRVNSVTGTSSFEIPIPLSPARRGFIPTVGLSYNSGSGNGVFGIGWDLSVPKISRKTEKLLPQYRDAEESDTFILSGAEDLIPLLENDGNNNGGGWTAYEKQKEENDVRFTVKRYRPRIEGLFAVIERWKNNATGETHWRSITGDNVHAYYGLTAESRLSDPNDATRVFEWLLCRVHDDKGGITVYEYKKEDFSGVENKANEKNRKNNCAQIYLKKILYGNRQPFSAAAGDEIPAEDDFLFKVIFDYGEHDDAENVPKDVDAEKNAWTCRKDPFSSYRAGFEIRTYRRCRRALVFHCFDEPHLPHSPYLVKSLQLFYDDDLDLTGSGQKINGFSYLTAARQNGHKWNAATDSYSTRFLPELEFTYQPHEWNTTITAVNAEDTANAPVEIDNRQYLWIDLFSEGVSGILTEQANGWFYKSNLGDGSFSKALPVSPKPSFQGLSRGKTSILELEGDGTKYLVHQSSEPKGFFKLTEEENWEPFRNFEMFPNVNPDNPNLRQIDLNGDGIADLLLTEDGYFRWFEGKGEKGFEVSRAVSREIDEEKAPAILFSDRTQSIFLADMNGDGLTDIVRVRNGEICYWSNLGYGRFGAKVTMDNAPLFDYPDIFNPKNLRLADIDGSGTIDVIYLGKNDFRVWMNLNGNEWTLEPQVISAFPGISDLSDVAVLDFLGTGTACIVYSSSLEPVQYIDLMAGKKPHLLNRYVNNCGGEVSIEYKSSAKFYLEDKKAGKNWITKLPFPVHCISKVTSEDKIRETIFTSSYKYAHGYFDRSENEFRGFGRVEQLDTEEFNRFKLNDAKNVVEEELHQPPVKTVSWFHTGAFFGRDKILNQFKSEYFQNPDFDEYELPEPVIADDLSADELREALRALKGMPLRSEVYAEDDSALSGNPYVASQSTVEIRRIQPKADNKHASFLVVPSEYVSYGYERNPADPRVSHTFVLEVDEIGSVKKNASVVYPRAERPPDLPDKVWDEQNKLHIACAEVSYTNDVIDDDAAIYRLRVPCENKSYEIAGIAQPPGFFFKKEDLKADIEDAEEILFEEEFDDGDDAGAQKRLSSHVRNYFLNEDFTASLPLGELSPLGIGHKSYRLALTKNLVGKYYGAKVTDQMLEDAKYVHSEGDEHWWTQSGEAIYAANPESNFYTPVGARDVFGNESFVEYDDFTLLPESVTDAIENVSSVENDYRTLSPAMLIDPNLNRSAVETDELGMVVKSAVMGKEGAGEGDTLEDPTARMEYELFNWKNNRKPNYVHLFAREKHGAANPRWQEGYAYSDGGGSVIMTKSQVEPGKALRWNEAGKQLEEVDADPRWIGSGRTVFNNKGNAVKQFEPYFSTTHEFESEAALVETGFTSIAYYDPLGRNTRIELPNGTFTKVEFDSWYFKSYDANDTVKDSQWYIERGSPDPDTASEPSDPEQRAAWLAVKHYDTPKTIHTDSLKNPFYAVSDYGNGKLTHLYTESDLPGRYAFLFDQKDRKISESYTNLLGSMIYNKTAEKGERWVFADAIGRAVKIWDNDLREFRTTFDKLHRPLSSFVKEGGTEFLFSHILYGDYVFDAAAAQNLNMKGRVYRVYDQAGSATINEVDFKGNPLQIERRLAKDYKSLIADWSVLDEITDLTAIDDAADSLLETEAFLIAGEVDALNRAVKITVPGGTVYQPAYNEANLLDSLQVQLQGQGDFITFLEEQNYDAKGQRQYAKFGNSTVTEYTYDPKTYRLTNLLTRLNENDSSAQAIQNLTYTFDPLGNITQIRDDAQQTHYFANSVVSPENKYEYDALYQLKKATGREHAGLGGNSQRNNLDIPFMTPLPHVNDSSAVRNYVEQYEYDDCGNITRMQHIANNANWTRRYKYESDDDAANNTNRLKATSAEGDPEGVHSSKYVHDLHGNMTSMPHLSAPDSLVWNFMDQLREVDLGGGGTAYYVYGSGGKRIRKVIEQQGGLIKERIYLGSVEIYRERQASGSSDDEPNLERYTVHISDDSGRIAQVDVKTIDKNNSDPANPLNASLIRYQYTNHLGSAVIETDGAANIISYEEYHPFGTSAYRVSKSGVDLSLKRYRFSGKEYDDETGFYYFGARYYAPWLGRWTSSDPAGFIDGANLYRYCRNTPVMLGDPDGCAPPERFTFPISDQRQADLSDFSPEAGRRLEQEIETTALEIEGHHYIFRGHLDVVNGGWFYTATSWEEINPETGDVIDSGTVADAQPGEGFYSESGGRDATAGTPPAPAASGSSEGALDADTARATGAAANYGASESGVNQAVRTVDNAKKAKIGKDAAAAVDALSDIERTLEAMEKIARETHAARDASRLASQSKLLPGARGASMFLNSGLWRRITNNPNTFEGIFARRLAAAGGDMMEAYRLMAVGAGSGRASATTAARVFGALGRGLGAIGLAGSAYALYNDIQTGNYGVVLGDAAGVVAGAFALAGAAANPIGLAAAGISLANIGGDFVGGLVEEKTGSRAAGVAAGTGTGLVTGAAFGAAIGSVVPVVGTAAGAVVGGIVGGIAGFIGSFW